MLEAIGLLIVIEFMGWSSRDPMGAGKFVGAILLAIFGVAILILIGLTVGYMWILVLIGVATLAWGAWVFFVVFREIIKMLIGPSRRLAAAIGRRYGFGDERLDDVMFLPYQGPARIEPTGGPLHNAE